MGSDSFSNCIMEIFFFVLFEIKNVDLDDMNGALFIDFLTSTAYILFIVELRMCHVKEKIDATKLKEILFSRDYPCFVIQTNAQGIRTSLVP